MAFSVSQYTERREKNRYIYMKSEIRWLTTLNLNEKNEYIINSWHSKAFSVINSDYPKFQSPF